MEVNFSKIEDYLNDRLSDSERKSFEFELKNNEDLTEKYKFYKNLQQKQDAELTNFEFDQKILPDITEINFTENKRKNIVKEISVTALLVAFIATSVYLFSSNQSFKNKVANIQIQMKEIEKELENERLIALEKSGEAVNSINETQEITNKLKEELIEKEKEIAILKTNGSPPDEGLLNEIKSLKKELSELKREYYENSGSFANTKDNSNKNGIPADLNFLKYQEHIDISWHNREKYKIRVYGNNQKLLHSSNGYLGVKWKVPINKPGFYTVKFSPQGKGKPFTILLDVGEKIKAWQPY